MLLISSERWYHSALMMVWIIWPAVNLELLFSVDDCVFSIFGFWVRIL